MEFSPDSAIICIDDDEAVLKALSFQLRQLINIEKVILEFFQDPKQALYAIPEIVKLNITVIFVLTDYQMPGLNGADFIKILKSKYPEIRFIMLSGQANDDSVKKLLQEKVLDHFVSKPWSLNDLLEKIKLLVPEDKLYRKK